MPCYGDCQVPGDRECKVTPGQKFRISLPACHLLALCFAKAIPSQHGRIMKCRLKIAGRSHIVEKSLENSSCVCTQALIQLNPRQSHANYHNRSVLFRWCHCCLSNSSLDLFWNLRVRFEECLISFSSPFPKAITRSTWRHLLLSNTGKQRGSLLVSTC